MTDLIEVTTDEFVLVEDTNTSTVEVADEGTVVVTETELTIISEAVQGPPGIRGEKGDSGDLQFTITAGSAIGGHRVVTINSTGVAAYASSAVPEHALRIVGLTTNAAAKGDPLNVKGAGLVSEPTWNWRVDTPVYLGTDGLLTQEPPSSPDAKFSVVVGFPITATELFINIGIPITLI